MHPVQLEKKHSSAEPLLRPTQHTLSASQRAAAPPSAVAREVGPSTACTELMLARLLIALLCHTTLSTCINTAAASFARSCASTYLLVSLQMEFWDVVRCWTHFSGRGSAPEGALRFCSGIYYSPLCDILTITTWRWPKGGTVRPLPLWILTNVCQRIAATTYWEGCWQVKKLSIFSHPLKISFIFFTTPLDLTWFNFFVVRFVWQ